MNANSLATLVGTSVMPLTNGNMPSYDEADSGYFGMENIPLTRVGDNSYLPLDIKADFRGAIQPWAQTPYFLHEPDGSVSALRPGYNGEFIRTFYAYSPTGSYDPADFRLTDSEYRPEWLTPDEYVGNILDGNEHGFLIRIRSTVDLTEARWYWVEHNGTLDSRFHKFLDVTNTLLAVTAGATGYINPATVGGGCYIPEINAFVTSSNNNANAFCYFWYTVDRPFQTVRSSTIANTLPVKNVDWQDMSGTVSGVSNQSIVLDASSAQKEALYFKYINDPLTRIGANYVHPSAGRRQLNYSYDAGVVRLCSIFFAYIPYAGGANQFGWSSHMDYNVATNTLRYTPVTDDPQRFQTLPWVISFGPLDESAPPGSGGDLYKANKFPIQKDRNAAFNIGNALTKLQFVGNKVVTSYCATSGADGFACWATPLSSYAGATDAAKKMDALRRPYFMRDVIGYQLFVPYDASILSKALNHVTFVGDNILRGTSNSKLYGQQLTTKPFLAYLPATTTTGTVYSTDSGTYKSCMPTPTTVVQAGTNYALSSMVSYIDGNGPMIISRASWSNLDATAATWLAANIDPLTGVPAITLAADPTTFRSKMDEITAATIAQSTFKPSSAAYSTHTLLPIVLIDTTAYFLYCMTFGNLEGVKYEYATIALQYSNGNLIWPATATSAVISRSAGTLLPPANNVSGPQYLNDWEGMAVYHHTDGNFYLHVNAPTIVSTIGGNFVEQRMFKLNSSMAFTSSTLTATLASWLGCSTGIHPKFGFYYTNIWNDSSAKCMMYYKDLTGTADQATRLQQSAENWISGGVATSTAFILSSKSASGFVLYSSEISVLMNGKIGTIPTQTIQLVSVTADPANKVFYFYVQWTGTGFILVPSLTTIPESATSTYVGAVTTNATGITGNTLQKVTRLDTYRLYNSAPIIGSAIRAYQQQPAIQAYVYDTTAEVNTFKSSHVPPSQSAVFNTWDRTTDTTGYFPGGAGATGDAAAWTFATNPDRIVQPLNTGSWTSFISPLTYDNYEFETTLSSTNADDDVIGMTAAFARINGTTNLQLIVARTCGGWAQQNGTAAAQAHNFAFNIDGLTLPDEDKSKLQAKLIGSNRSNAATPAGPGWAGIFSRIRVVRRGNTITAYCSDWSTDRTTVPLLESSVITLDMTTIPALAPLLSTAKYGYTTISQAQATYYDTTFSGGLDTGRVVDLQTNTVWKYNFSTSAWAATAITPKDELGYVRTVANPDTGKTYFVTQDAVIKQ